MALCRVCGGDLVDQLGWDPDMTAVVRKSDCPDGCTHSLVWVWPEHATQAERDELGLVVLDTKESE